MPNCNIKGAPPLILSEDQTQPIRYTYRVMWNVINIYLLPFTLKLTPKRRQESDTPWVNFLSLHEFDVVVTLIIGIGHPVG
jgi:hypothetical protein